MGLVLGFAETTRSGESSCGVDTPSGALDTKTETCDQRSMALVDMSHIIQLTHHGAHPPVFWTGGDCHVPQTWAKVGSAAQDVPAGDSQFVAPVERQDSMHWTRWSDGSTSNKARG